MSLKALHIVFITCSILLAFFVGGWLWHDSMTTKDHAEMAMGIASDVTGVLLVFYAKAILRKLRQISCV